MKRLTSCLLVFTLFTFCADAQTSGAKKPASKSKRKPAAATKAKSPAAPLRTKIAEGRYELRSQANSALRTWEEPWTLYKTKTGYEVEELWKAARGGDPNAVVIDVLLTLAPGLYPTQARIGSDLSPSQLLCSMTMTEFRCAADGKQNSMPMTGAYNFFLPSPWLLSSIGRRAQKKPDQPVIVKLVQMTGMGATGPKLTSFDANVAYIGEDQVEVGATRLGASIYEIRGPGGPAIVIWISAEGVVLMMQDAAKPEQRMELVEFKKFAAF